MAEVSGGLPSVVAAAHARYTLCGEPAAEARVVQDLSRLSTGIDSEVGDGLRALVLVGPFARAEGGIAHRDGEPHAADPGYELLALFKTKPDRRQRALSMMAATWTRLLGAHVAIRALSVRDLSHAPPTRFWFHAGRRQLLTLSGDPTLVSAIPRHEAADLHWDEAVFTLCENLTALALVTLDSGGEPNASHEAALVGRMQRAVLACGDALLLWRGQYGDVLKARAEALQTVCTSAALRAGYRDAIAWSARPDAGSLKAATAPLARQHAPLARGLVPRLRGRAHRHQARPGRLRASSRAARGCGVRRRAGRVRAGRAPVATALARARQPGRATARQAVALQRCAGVRAARAGMPPARRAFATCAGDPASPPSDSALESALRAFAPTRSTTASAIRSRIGRACRRVAQLDEFPRARRSGRPFEIRAPWNVLYAARAPSQLSKEFVSDQWPIAPIRRTRCSPARSPSRSSTPASTSPAARS